MYEVIKNLKIMYDGKVTLLNKGETFEESKAGLNEDNLAQLVDSLVIRKATFSKPKVIDAEVVEEVTKEEKPKDKPKAKTAKKTAKEHGRPKKKK